MTASAGSGPWPVVAALALLPVLSVPAGAGYRQGETVRVEGRVADAAGRPLPGLKVSFEAARSRLSVRKLRTVDRHPTAVATTTGEDGEYRFTWSWHDFYNRFAVEVFLRDPASDGGWRSLQRLDLSRRMTQGSPVVADLQVEADEAVERHLAFWTTLATEAEREAFREMGAPDRTDRLSAAGREEVTWWYFRVGRAYRFVDGQLDEIARFDPVEAF
ncbi:MAG: hypothetical protein R3325_15440 [Thermoanaerobaculia bacterium]|nr:hypothetical protein [Thermoanaerobaculia bacterium]